MNRRNFLKAATAVSLTAMLPRLSTDNRAALLIHKGNPAGYEGMTHGKWCSLHMNQMQNLPRYGGNLREYQIQALNDTVQAFQDAGLMT